jgi:signal transduction histidine kinase
MNPPRLADDAHGVASGYVRGVQALRRWAASDPGLAADVAIAIAGAVLAAVAAWNLTGLASGRAPGPAWLLVLEPVLIGAALLLRRRAPLVMWSGVWAGVVLQDLVTRHPPQGLEFLFAFLAGGYSLGAHASLRRGIAGLAVTVGVVALISHLGGVGLTLSFVPVLGAFLIGVLVRGRRRTTALARRNAALEQQAEQAAAAERARIARELHDIVAHHLSVIVLQAAGARASGTAAEATLEKIENNGRQALTETRRLLGVLRETGQPAGLAPQPGIGQLDELAASVRAAGLPVHLVVDGDPAAVPAAVNLSVYRIVQEALTNVLKHAGPARADVTIGCAGEAVTIEVADDGTGQGDGPATAGGNGLAGMRERAAIFGGELHAGPRPGGGFAVRARLPLGEPRPPADPLPPAGPLPPAQRPLLADRLR